MVTCGCHRSMCSSKSMWPAERMTTALYRSSASKDVPVLGPKEDPNEVITKYPWFRLATPFKPTDWSRLGQAKDEPHHPCYSLQGYYQDKVMSKARRGSWIPTEEHIKIRILVSSKLLKDAVFEEDGTLKAEFSAIVELFRCWYPCDIEVMKYDEFDNLLANNRRNVGSLNMSIKRTIPKDCFAILILTCDDIFDVIQGIGAAFAPEKIGYSTIDKSYIKKSKIAKETMYQIFKPALHEFIHILSIDHCSNWYCLMNGVWSDKDMKDTHSYWDFCPLCCRKFEQAFTKSKWVSDPKARYINLKNWCDAYPEYARHFPFSPHLENVIQTFV